jgi:thymidylate synthase
MNWQADSFHVYGKDQKDFTERFWNRLGSTTLEERVYHFFDPAIQEIWAEAEGAVLEKIARHDREHVGR